MRTRLAPILALCLGLNACVGGRSPEARFFQLQPAANMPQASGTLDPAVVVVVRTVALETYLRQPQVARRVKPHEVKYSEFTRWAEPLDRNITRVIAENLRHALRTDRVVIAPQHLAGGDLLTLSVEITRFEGQPDGRVLLDASWLLHRESDATPAEIGTAQLTAAAATGDPEDVAAAQSRLLADLCARIAADLPTRAPPAAP